jgi:class 3 adenylate cyclase
VNYAARLVGAITGPEIWLSDRAKEDLDRTDSNQHALLTWDRHERVQLKGFVGNFILWSLSK